MKNALIGILVITAAGSIAFGYIQKVNLDKAQAICVSEKEALEMMVQDQQLRAKEFQKMAELAQQEAIVQRTICEEQLKAFKK